MSATWFSATALVGSIIFTIVVIATTNGKEVSSGWWVKNADVVISVGAMATKSSFASIMGVALYQHLWYTITAADKDIEGASAKAGMRIREIEAQHQASKMKISLFSAPSWSKAWLIGAVMFLLGAAIVPVIQYTVDIVPQTETVTTVVSMFHAQLDTRLALVESPNPDGPHGDEPIAVIGGVPEVMRGATLAIFGEDTTFKYTNSNVTGPAIFGPVEYPDIDCSAKFAVLPERKIPGTIEAITNNGPDFFTAMPDSMLYNFTSAWVKPILSDKYAYYPKGIQVLNFSVNQADVLKDMTPVQRQTWFEQYNEPNRKVWMPEPNEMWTNYTIFRNETERENRTRIVGYRELAVNFGLSNITHWYNFTCAVRPAKGMCSVDLSTGAGIMGKLRCIRDNWIEYPDRTSDIYSTNAPALFAYGAAFADVFKGTVYTDSAGLGLFTGLFASATAFLDKRSGFVFMPDPQATVRHMQRVLWNLPMTVGGNGINKAPVALQAYGPTTEQIAWRNSTTNVLPVTALDNRQIFVVEINLTTVTSMLCVVLALSAMALAYLVLSENRVLGRLCRDSLVHNLTVGGRYGPAIRGACMAGLGDVLKKAGDERLQFMVLVTAKPGFVGHLGMGEMDGTGKFNYGKSVTEEPIPGMIYGGIIHPELSQEWAKMNE